MLIMLDPFLVCNGCYAPATEINLNQMTRLHILPAFTSWVFTNIFTNIFTIHCALHVTLVRTSSLRSRRKAPLYHTFLALLGSWARRDAFLECVCVCLALYICSPS